MYCNEETEQEVILNVKCWIWMYPNQTLRYFTDSVSKILLCNETGAREKYFLFSVLWYIIIFFFCIYYVLYIYICSNTNKNHHSNILFRNIIYFKLRWKVACCIVVYHRISVRKYLFSWGSWINISNHTLTMLCMVSGKVQYKYYQ